MLGLVESKDQAQSGSGLRQFHHYAASGIVGRVAVAPTQVDRHEIVLNGLEIRHCTQVAVQLVIRHPNMPAPHDRPRSVAYGDDGVALADRGLRHLERNVLFIGGQGDILYQPLGVLPDEAGVGGRAARIVVDIRIADPVVQVIDKPGQNVRSDLGRGIGRRIRIAVLDGIAVNQR